MTVQWTAQYGEGARHGGTLGGGGTGLCRGSALSDSARYVVARPGPYTVRVRHFGPQKMYINMCVDGKNCGESWVRSRVCRLLGLGVFALRADNEEHWGTGNKLVTVDHVLRVQRRLDSRQGDGTTVRFAPLGLNRVWSVVPPVRRSGV